MRKLMLAASALLSLTFAIPAAAQETARCVTEQQAIDGVAKQGLKEYRRGGPVSTSEDGMPADLAIAFLDKDGEGVGVWFRGGCVSSVGPATKKGADDFFEMALDKGRPV